MFGFYRRKNLRSVAPAFEHRSFHNPYFPHEQKLKRSSSDRWTYLGIGTLLTAGFLYLLLGTDFFTLTSISIQGNQIISNDDIQKQVNAVLDQKIFGIFSRRNFWLFNPNIANAQIRDAIQSEIALAEIHTNKKFPHSVVIRVEERIPSLILSSNQQHVTVDLDGFVSQSIALEQASEHFPKIIDLNARPIHIGDQALRPELISWLFELREILPKQTPFHIDHFEIPVVHCTEKVTTSEKKTLKELEEEQKNASKEEQLRSIQERLQEGEISVTESLEFLRQLRVDPKPDLDPLGEGETGSSLDQEIIEYKTERKATACDYLNVIDELLVKTSEGPLLAFDHGQSLSRQINHLRAVIQEKIPDLTAVQSIDLRFQDRVYYK